MNSLGSAVRPRFSLDGMWQFRTDPGADQSPTSAEPWRTVAVPAPWQSQAADLRDYQGVAWYRRDFEIPADWHGGALILHFGAVDYRAEVRVNGHSAGSHVGGYLPFELDIAPLVRFGAANEILVRVEDPSDDRTRWPEEPFSEISHGKQSWYGALSGIWQSVWVEARPALHIVGLKITPDPRSGQVLAEISLNTDAPAGAELALRVIGPDGERVADGSFTPTGRSARVTLDVADPVRWELDRPALYTLAATLHGTSAVDQHSARFGFRLFEERDGSLWLNDRPLMLRGALDQDYYPDLITIPPSYEYALEQAHMAKRMGLNCLRCHIKIADPRYLEAADEAGLLIWAELPNWQRWTPQGGQRGVETLLAAIERDWNHPSVMIWSVINESWGVDLINNPEHRAWLVQAFDTVKAAAHGRLVVDNSACFANFHLKTDIDDFHFYAAMPDERAHWSEWVAQFAARPVWSFGADIASRPRDTANRRIDRWLPNGAGYGAVLPEVARRGNEPLLVSEFGNWGLPSLQSLRGAEGVDPWWFETGDDWGEGIVYPHGVEKRFERLGLDRIFGDYERFAAATRRAEFDALQFEIEEMRRHPSIGGYVITEFTDVHWECNGLLDMRRNPKMPLDALASLNADTILIPDRSQGACRSGGMCAIAVSVSHWGAGQLEAPVVRWSIDGVAQGELAGHVVNLRDTVALGTIQFAAPEVAQAHQYVVRLELWDSGRRVAASHYNLAVYPHATGEKPALYVHGAPELRELLLNLGYPLSDTPDGVIMVARRYDAELHRQVLAGARVVLLAEDADALTNAPEHALSGVRIVERHGTAWQGSWASSFGWMAGQWPGDGILDDSFAGVMPERVITGIPQRMFPNDVQSGLFVGWIHRPVGLIATVRPGRGTLVLSTFRLTERLGSDPVAGMLFERLVNTLAR